jgi:hypothetical protein
VAYSGDLTIGGTVVVHASKLIVSGQLVLDNAQVRFRSICVDRFRSKRRSAISLLTLRSLFSTAVQLEITRWSLALMLLLMVCRCFSCTNDAKGQSATLISMPSLCSAQLSSTVSVDTSVTECYGVSGEIQSTTDGVASFSSLIINAVPYCRGATLVPTESILSL